MESENSISDLGIASFAVYLKPGDDSFVKKLMEAEAPPVVRTSHKPKDGEIGVFGAEEYFNMSLVPTQLQAGDGERINNKVMRRRSINSSESSWTTQSSATNFLKTNKFSSTRGGFFAGFSCYKSCNDTKSINIKSSSSSSSRGISSSILDQQPQFTFPVIDQNRPSLEVFGSKPPCNNKTGDIVAMNLERKLSVLTWDAIPSIKNRSTVGGLEEEEEEMRSEGSSDLFEIETISAAGPCMYAPSEASIEWSVVTASAPDFSDYKLDHHPFNSPPSKSNFRQAPKIRGLLGCNNDKAVQLQTNIIPIAASSPQLKRFLGLTNNK